MEYKVVPLDQLHSRASQVRQEFDQEFIEELAHSVKREGVLVPIIVRTVRKGYEIVAGEQRWRAAKIAKLKEVPVAIMEADDRRVLEVALLENVKRKDLHGWEREDAIAALWETKAYGSLSDLGKVLDVQGDHVKEILRARELRRAEHLPKGSSTRMITTVAPLDRASRKAILEAQEQGDIEKDVHNVTKLVSSLRKIPEGARPRIVEAVAKKQLDLDDVDSMPGVAETEDDVEQLVEAKRTLPEREYHSVVSYVKQERAGGRKPVLKTIISGDVTIWNTYLNTLEAARDEILLLSPSKCRGWDVEHRVRLQKALNQIDRHVQEMLIELGKGT